MYDGRQEHVIISELPINTLHCIYILQKQPAKRTQTNTELCHTALSKTLGHMKYTLTEGLSKVVLVGSISILSGRCIKNYTMIHHALTLILKKAKEICCQYQSFNDIQRSVLTQFAMKLRLQLFED